MAEKYGTIPKRFTKAWWSWYWMYYKWHTIGVIFVLMLIAVTVIEAVTAEKYDVTLTYSGQAYIQDSTTEKIEEILSPLCDDLDGNGESSLYFSNLNIDLGSTDAEYLQAMRLKLDMAISEDATYLFIMDKSIADIYKGESVDDCAFAPLEDWVTADISEFDTYTAHGNSYGIDISNLKIFNDAEINTDGMYLFMRYYPRKDQIKEHLKGYNASIEFANRMLSGE